jgi:hypothetical protein
MTDAERLQQASIKNVRITISLLKTNGGKLPLVSPVPGSIVAVKNFAGSLPCLKRKKLTVPYLAVTCS